MLVLGGLDGPAIGLSRPRRRRGRPRAADDDGLPPGVPVTRATVIAAEPFASDEHAELWLQSVSGRTEALDEQVASALAVVNRALHIHRAAAQDPYAHEVGATAALAVRVGVGSGDELADGRWREAVSVPADPQRRRRVDALQPQERLAAVLGGRDHVGVCETLLLRARADLDAARPCEAALQLRAGLDALLEEVPSKPDQDEDLATLRASRDAVGVAAREALAGEISEAAAERIAAALAVCERVLRRERILGAR